MDREAAERAWLEREEKVTEKRDAQGRLWRKVYLGGGEHLNNWLAQCRELAGPDNVQLERIDAQGLYCFAEGAEDLCRIWVRADAMADDLAD